MHKGGHTLCKLPGKAKWPPNGDFGPGPTFPEGEISARIPPKYVGCVLRPTEPNCGK